VTPSPHQAPVAGLKTHVQEPLTLLAERIRAGGVLGRSTHMCRLFAYLIECSIAGRAPKETEVAIDVFGKKPTFDVAQDAMVRVYVHKLRRRLEEYYAGDGCHEQARLSIPRGDYRIDIIQGPGHPPPLPLEPDPELPPPPATPQVRRKPYRIWVVGAALTLSLLVNAAVLLRGYRHLHPPSESVAAAATNPVWSRVLQGDRTIYLVLGDLYMFGETDAGLQLRHLLREPSINSASDLQDYLKVHPEIGSRYRDMRLNYLPTSVAYALRDVLPLLAPVNERVRIALASDLTPSIMATSDVIYVGYLSGMGMLGSMLFTGSRFTVASSSDELIDHHTGTHYISQAALPVPAEQKYRDYGYFATFAGPRGTQIIVIAGTRDEGVMHTAEVATHGASLQQLNGEHGARSFEALYAVLSLDGIDLDGKLLLTSNLDVSKIWTGESSAGAPASPRAAGIPTVSNPIARLGLRDQISEN
jgi:hypothetical protein